MARSTASLRSSCISPPHAAWHSLVQSAKGTRVGSMAVFTEVGDRVWVARYEWWDVNVSVIEGEEGLLVVDTNASSQAARDVIADLRRLSPAPVVGIVNTHEHFDHTFGNQAFRAEFAGVPITAHEEAAANTVARGRELQARAASWPDPRADEIAETTLLPAD